MPNGEAVDSNAKATQFAFKRQNRDNKHKKYAPKHIFSCRRVGQAIQPRSFSMFGLGGEKKAKKTAPNKLAVDLQDEKRKFEVIINNIEDGVLLIDSQGVIQLCNPAASTLTGWPEEEAVGIDVQAVMTLIDDQGKSYFESPENPFRKIFSKQETVRDSKATLKNRDEKLLSLNLVITPLLNKAGEVTAAIAVFRDVSEERAQEKQRADFISTASHEMRTPVAAIEGYLALSLNEKVATIDARARDYLEKAHTNTQHLGNLFQDLLTSAKAEDGRLTSNPTAVEFGSFLEQLTKDLSFVAKKKGLYAEFVVGGNSTIDATSKAGDKVIRPLYYVYVDPDRVREVVTNLFDNAVKYTPEGSITIGLTGDNQVVQCYIKDTGPGIPTDDIPHLFQKFYRVDNSATRTIGGTGLGLFICKKIIELYGGRIWAESQVDKGSSFYINLPRISTEKARSIQETTKNNAASKPINSLATP